MKVSVIIPTHERPAGLRQCLETLLVQDVDPPQLEVVVVDDGSKSDIAVLVADVSAAGDVAMRCESQALTGLNGARNRGAAVARGDILAFLDDDTLVSPGWAQALLDAFGTYGCAGVGGKVDLSLAVPPPSWLAARRYYLAEYDLGSQPHWIEGDPMPVGANCAVRRTDFERVGGFRPGLDRIGGSLVSNGDTEFFRRLRAAGGRLRYEPDARVVHCVPAERVTIEFFVKRYFAQGVSDQLMFAVENRPTIWGQRLHFSRDLARLLGPTANTVARDLLRGRGMLNARFFSAYWRGRLVAVGKRP